MTLKLEDIDPKEDIRMTGAELKRYLVEAKVEALEKLKKAWHEDRKTFDYSPATYDFIIGKELKELTGGV